MQTTWEVLVYTFGYLPIYAAIYHPVETIIASFGFAAFAIYRA